jgi:hypothetical protein
MLSIRVPPVIPESVDVWIHDCNLIRRRDMRRDISGSIINLVLRPLLTVGLLTLVVLFGGAASAKAQVKRVQMHIGGYLCGN